MKISKGPNAGCVENYANKGREEKKGGPSSIFHKFNSIKFFENFKKNVKKSDLQATSLEKTLRLLY